MIKQDGGYAFPYKEEDGHGGFISGNGMTLRDYFAAAAISGIMSSPLYSLQVEGAWDRDTMSADAYQLADAMIAARSK